MSVRAGEIDWIARWAEMQRAADDTQQPRAQDRWLHRAARFDKMSRERPDPSLDALSNLVGEHDVVADLGAGVGRHCVPLSQRCAKAFAVEPSAAMRERLQARIAERAATNVEVIPQSWPCELPLVDVSYSVHVLYGVSDVAPFLEEMSRRTRRTCVLVLGVRAPSDALSPLWEAIHGRAKPRRPAALEALAVLHQLGHRASLRFLAGTERALDFTNSDEDVNELCHRLGLEADASGRSKVRAVLDRGTLGTTGPNAWIEWQP